MKDAQGTKLYTILLLLLIPVSVIYFFTALRLLQLK